VVRTVALDHLVLTVVDVEATVSSMKSWECGA
jgi:hypothetical protein